ncbi:MAG: hypothetical protein EA409_12845 [Saprospirales bacterium]|nr:MAG: hypothetical protein EA409_12845 [Saprospirales bacterium]
MRNWLLGICFLMGVSFVHASEVVFKVEVSTDTVLMGNYFEVKFTVENARPSFSPPDFTDFEIVGGPNQSSSFSMVNGRVSQSATYTYFLQPREEGIFYVQAAAIEVDGKYLETPPVEIFVMPNPDGIIENPHQLRHIQPRESVPQEEEKKQSDRPRRTIQL